jgi:hypothetical protein
MLTESNTNIVLTRDDLLPYKKRTDSCTLCLQDFNINYDKVRRANSITFIDNGQFITFKRK